MENLKAMRCVRPEVALLAPNSWFVCHALAWWSWFGPASWILKLHQILHNLLFLGNFVSRFLHLLQVSYCYLLLSPRSELAQQSVDWQRNSTSIREIYWSHCFLKNCIFNVFLTNTGNARHHTKFEDPQENIIMRNFIKETQFGFQGEINFPAFHLLQVEYFKKSLGHWSFCDDNSKPRLCGYIL